MAEPRRRMQIIMGPRQVGKSTIVYQFCDGLDTPYEYFAADGVNRFDTTWIPNRWQEARMKMDLHGDKERILIFDEVQKIDGWSEQVKKEWDQDTRDDTSGFEKFRQLYAEHITSAFIVGPEGLPLEDFFSLDINPLFRKKLER